MTNSSNKCPVVIVTGCLGSGKTTLLSKILKEKEMHATAVLVNEFGKVGLDHHLLRKVDEKTVLLSGGCICCSKREDLEKELTDLLNKKQSGTTFIVNRIVIETTGLADPAPIIFTILKNPLLKHHFYIESIITTVDAVNGLLHLEKQEESIKQITSSDKIVITKMDIAHPKQLKMLKEKILELNPSAEIIESYMKNNIYPSNLFKNTIKSTRDFLNKIKDHQALKNNSKIRSLSLTFDSPLDWTAFGLWLSMLLYSHGEDILRVKGLIDVGQNGPVVLNGVQHIIHPPDHLDQWPSNDHRSHIVFITRSIDPKSILNSLKTFQKFLGSEASIME
ncbi:CobW family GTP-binding protein [Bacillus smithii]|uniref:CobW family GTP-binding protein n=1 Tax=Bacillus smithii TaxID=1479 RepID=UPI0022E64696|nr:GTP-binding protein [Bacillus smithii]